MENKKEFLNEENYQQSKKKILRISLIVLIVGVVIGLGLIITGVVLSHNDNGINIDLNPEQGNNETLRTESDVQSEIDEIESQIDAIDIEINKLENEKSKIFVEDMDFSDRYYAKDEEITLKKQERKKLRDSKLKLEKELREIQHGFDSQIDQFEGIFNTASDGISKAKYVPFYMFGAFIIIASGMISFAIYMFAKKREITAFTVQQVMPVAQEGVEKMTPTMGKVGKELAKGIKEGINEADDNK